MIKNAYCFCYIVLNAGAYLDYSLASIMKLVELNPKSGIVIVEGADQFSHALEKTEKGLSIDGTREIVNKWVLKHPDRIMYSPMGAVQDKRELRNETLDLVRNFFDVQYVFGVDGDELVKIDDFLKMDEIISAHENHLVFWLKHFMFWGDFGRRYTDKFSGEKESVIFNAQNLSYDWWHTQISLNKQPINRFMPDAILKMDIPFYHYGYISPWKRLLMKRLYSFSQLQWFAEHIEETFMWKKNANPWETFFKGQPWETNHWAEMEDFPLVNHPKEIKSHPWFGKTAKEIWGSEEVYPTFEIS